MKKKGCLILLLGLLLTSCTKLDVNTESSSKDGESKISEESSFESLEKSSDESSNDSSSNLVEESSSDLIEESSSESTTTIDFQKEANVNARTCDVVENAAGSYQMIASKLGKMQHETGDFVENKQGIGIYRCYKTKKSDSLKLLAKPTIYEYEMESMIYNTDAYKGIYEYQIEYKSDTGIRLTYSKDRSYSNEVILGKTSGFMTVTVKTDLHCLFRISAIDTEALIKSVKLSYNNEVSDYDATYMSYSSYRLDVPYKNFDNIAEGEKRSMPAKVSYQNGQVKVVKSKEYTYHSYDYLQTHQNEAREICYIDPVDVANYYMLFRDFPLNYQDRRDGSVPSDMVRAYSTWTREDGYALSVPYKKDDRFVYFELDIDNTGRYKPSKGRGVGRLVVWEKSFDFDEYNDHPVIVYTDDHYKTFREYMNDGTFGPRFNAEGHLASYKYNKPTTLTY
jgi:hypothetical protein